MRMSPTIKVSSAAWACTVLQNSWLARASSNVRRNSSRTRQKPNAISMGTPRATPLVRLELEIDHDFPLIQVSCDIVIKGQTHQHHHQRNADLLSEQLRALGNRTALDGFHRLINHLPPVEQ